MLSSVIFVSQVLFICILVSNTNSISDNVHVIEKQLDVCDLFSISDHLSSPSAFSGVCVTQSFVFYVIFVNHCFSFRSFRHSYSFDLRLPVTPLVSSSLYWEQSKVSFNSMLYMQCCCHGIMALNATLGLDRFTDVTSNTDIIRKEDG